MDDPQDDLPATLTLDEAYRAAFYFVLRYLSEEKQPSEDITLLSFYMWSDPARWTDWVAAVRRGLADGGLANPGHGVDRSIADMPPLKVSSDE